MDAIDRKILGLLQQDAARSVAEIGNLVGLSSTPCWKRIQRLEAEGVIQKRVAIVDQDKIGLGVTVFVSIETGDHSQAWLTHFAEVVEAMPEAVPHAPVALMGHPPGNDGGQFRQVGLLVCDLRGDRVVGGAHQVTPKWRAAATPERHPSSWNPHPW